jgi:hypothetical protein
LKTGIDFNDKKNEEKAKLLRILGNASRETEQAFKKLRNGDKTDLGLLESRISNKWIEASALLAMKLQQSVLDR